MKQRLVRAIVAVSGTGLALVLAAACGTQHSPSAQGTSGPGGGDASSSAGTGGDVSSGPSQPGNPTTGPTTVPVGRLCAASDLRIAQTPGGDAAGGTVVVAITLTNKSGHACSMSGYPAFTLSSSMGMANVSIQHGGNGIPALSAPADPVTISPMGKAGFLLVYMNRPTSASGTCNPATSMKLQIGSGTVSGPVQISLCGTPLKVSPYVPSSKLASA